MKKNHESDLKTSPLTRFLKLSSLLTNVGTSILGNKVTTLFQNQENTKYLQKLNWIKNAQKVVEVLGNMKGGVMKVGQLLSLQTGMLPPEITQVLSQLQKESPAVPYVKMKALIKRELKDQYQLIERIDTKAIAAASIGQVYKIYLKDGRKAVMKVQYPNIAQAVKADLANLKKLMQILLSMFVKVDLESVWLELQTILNEELDYTIEAQHTSQIYKLYKDDPKIITPQVFPELSTKRVLTMEILTGIDTQQVLTQSYEQELKDKWGQVIFDFICKGLLKNKFLHVDPNLSNFAFLKNGSLIVYDFGAMKRISCEFKQKYNSFVKAAIEGKSQILAEKLKDMGVHRSDGRQLSKELIEPVHKIIKEILNPNKPYRFNKNEEIIRVLMDLKIRFLPEVLDIVFPNELIFIDRTIFGHFGNLGQLSAKGDWGRQLKTYLT